MQEQKSNSNDIRPRSITLAVGTFLIPGVGQVIITAAGIITKDSTCIYDVFEELKSKCPISFYLLDILPQRMDDSLIYFDNFDIYYNEETFKKNIAYKINFESYFKKFYKIIFMLLGYNNHQNTYFDSSLFYDEYKLSMYDDSIEPLIKSQNNLNYINIRTESDLNLFKEVIMLSLKGFTNCTIYFKNLDILIDVNGLCSEILIFNNIDLVKTVAVTEGLYLYQPVD